MKSELMNAVLRSDAVAIRAAIGSGADPDEVVDGMTPLLFAIFRGDIETVRLLLQSGADANLSPEGSGSPLWHADDDFGLREIAALPKAYGARKA